jgi:hypothetical protein
MRRLSIPRTPSRALTFAMSASNSEHPESSSSLKRKRNHPGDSPGSPGNPQPNTKVTKRASARHTHRFLLLTYDPSRPSVFPIFEKRGAGDEETEEKKPFRWLTPSLGATRSCLHGVHLAPTASSRVAAFDLDGTLIKSQFIQVGRAGPKGGASGSKRVMKRQASGLGWEWWRAVVPQMLKEARDSGCVRIPPPPLCFSYFRNVCLLLLSSTNSTMHRVTPRHALISREFVLNTHRRAGSQ